MNNFILKQNFYNEYLLAYHNNDIDIRKYFEAEFKISSKHLVKANIFKDGAPELKVPKDNFIGSLLGKNNSFQNDIDNAIILYEAMKINRVQASDERMWAFLCHVPYFNFIKKRYKPNKDGKYYKLNDFFKYEDKSKRITIRNYIKDRFFTSTSNRTLRRNGLATLWWASELTKEPWEKHTDIPKKNKDKYHYTKMILENPDLYSSTFERTLGKEINIVFPLFDCIEENNLGRAKYRELIKKLNSEAHLIHYSLLSYKNIRIRLDNLLYQIT